jgi:hypothetical protein
MAEQGTENGTTERKAAQQSTTDTQQPGTNNKHRKATPGNLQLALATTTDTRKQLLTVTRTDRHNRQSKSTPESRHPTTDRL